MKAGDILLVKFPFSDLVSTKKRPALVLHNTIISPKSNLITIAMVTSRLDGLKIKGDTTVAKWKEANLLHPSIIRLSKIATIDGDLAEKVIGRLASQDIKLVKSQFSKLFSNWI
jgi:mRNA interferase MazF